MYNTNYVTCVHGQATEQQPAVQHLTHQQACGLYWQLMNAGSRDATGNFVSHWSHEQAVNQVRAQNAPSNWLAPIAPPWARRESDAQLLCSDMAVYSHPAPDSQRRLMVTSGHEEHRRRSLVAQYNEGCSNLPSTWGKAVQAQLQHFQRQMRHGSLTFTGIQTNAYGGVVCNAEYSPHEAKAVVGSGYTDFLPTQPSLVREKLENYIRSFTHAPKFGAILEPIYASPLPDGRLVVLDGHHRLAAAMFVNMPLRIEIHMTPEPDANEGDDWSRIRQI